METPRETTQTAQRKAYNDAYYQHKREGTLDKFRNQNRPYKGRFKDDPSLIGLDEKDFDIQLRRLYGTAKRARMKALVQKLKDAPCVDCGGRFPPEAMDFDHTGDDKRFNVSRAWSEGYGEETILKEIAKCELVCSNCHRVRTARRHAGVDV
jgi:hypothetical protein